MKRLKLYADLPEDSPFYSHLWAGKGQAKVKIICLGAAAQHYLEEMHCALGTMVGGYLVTQIEARRIGPATILTVHLVLACHHIVVDAGTVGQG